MERKAMAVAVLATMAMAASSVPDHPHQVGRHLLLDEGGSKAAGLVRFYSQAIELAEGAKQSWVTITRTGDFYDPRYGDFKITPTHLEQMVQNFNARVVGQDIFLDVAHKPSDGAAGKFTKLAIEGTKLRGLVEWTPFGTDAVKTRGFAYLSAEFHENWKDNEQQKAHGCVLLGAGLTTRPVIKNLDPVQLAEAENDHADGVRLCISQGLLRELTERTPEISMNFLEQLKIKLLALGLSEEAVTRILAHAKTQLEAAADDKAKGAIVLAWEETGKSIQAEIKKLSAAGITQQPVTITLAAPGATQVDVAAEVQRVLAAQATVQAEQKTKLDGNLKLLADTLGEDKSLTPEGVTKLAAEVAPLVSAASTPEQVKHLAALQLANWGKLTAATKLATMGYQPASGHVHITVDQGNTIKALQTEIDRRLGLTDKADPSKRFFATGGKLLEANKNFAEVALAQFDSQPHVAMHLHEEHKMLAAGTGTISDIKVPYSVERTVLREMLYNLVSLNFVDVGTAPFAPTVQIPYSYRDTSAAGASRVRRYEQQAIQRAGVIQTWDTAYPIPQKLSFRVSNEMRYLMGAAPIDFEPVAENVRNMIRIIGEDTEALNMNELVRSADEFGATAVAGEVLTASVQGTNKVFPLANFPVVRPRTVFDLQGGVAVATVNPVTVTLGGTPRNEYVPNSDGSALAAGTYWVMDWNLGELRFVDQTGAAVTPANATALTVSYSYSTNAAKFSTDLGALTVGQVYDNLLTAIGGRKVVIGNDRFYNPGMVAMSLAVDNALSQATTFTANGARNGSSLNADGSVGITKGMATFNPTAPGLMMADTRILVGERGNTRFRMVKPFAMNPLEEARDANGAFIGAKEGYGEQYVVSHTPLNRKNALTSIVVYSAAGRVARVA
jgi:hypothetical protein